MLRIYITPPPPEPMEGDDAGAPPAPLPPLPLRAAAPPGRFFEQLADPRLYGQNMPPSTAAPPGKFFEWLTDPKRFGQLVPPKTPPGQFLASIGLVPPLPTSGPSTPPADARAPERTAPPGEPPAEGDGEGDGIARNAAAGFNQGVYGTFGFPADAATWLINRGIDGVNAVSGSHISNLEELPLGSRSIARNLEYYAGIPDPEKIRAVTLGEKVARGVGEGAAYAIAPQFALRGAAAALGTRVLPALETLFGNSKTLGELGRDVLAGGVGGGTGKVAYEAAPEPLKPIAEFGGNMLGGAATALGEAPRWLAQGVHAIGDLVAPLGGGWHGEPVPAGGAPYAPMRAEPPARSAPAYENRSTAPAPAAGGVGAPARGNLDAEIFAPPDVMPGRFEQPAPPPAGGPAEPPRIRQPDGKFYSVAYEARLSPKSYPGVSRWRHNREANEALLRAMEQDPEFARAMRELGIDLRRTPKGLAPRNAPPGWTWHHASEPGVVQLVPRWQHKSSIFRKVFHPDKGNGGFVQWGK